MIRGGEFCVAIIASLSVVGTTEAQASGPPCTASSEFQAADFSMPVTELRTGAARQVWHVLTQFGVTTIIRYYDKPEETLPCKTLLKDETDAIISEKFSIAVVFQHNNDDPETFFDPTRGREDAKRALALAEANGQPPNTAIYFGADGVDEAIKSIVYEYSISGGRRMTEARKNYLLKKDRSYKKHIYHYERFLEYRSKWFDAPVKSLNEKSILPFVERYFADIGQTFQEAARANAEKTYEIGAYGSGLICGFLLSNKFRGPKSVKYCWLAQSTGWPRYKDFKKTNKWSLLQQNPTSCVDWKYLPDTRRKVDASINATVLRG